MKKSIPRILLVILIALTVVWGTSLIRCEVLTHKYYTDFEFAHQNNTMLGDIEYFKVLKCDGQSAEVYYVSKNMTDANILFFKYNDSIWTEENWETIWSSTGSASDIVYPYIWHFIYGGI